MRRESQDVRVQTGGLDSGENSVKDRSNYLMGGTSRFSSIDKPLVVSLPKRQSAVFKDSMAISRASESKVVPLNEEEEEADVNSESIIPISGGEKVNLGKGSSRGSLKRRMFAQNNSSGYYTNSGARVQSKIRSGNANSIAATKDTFEVETYMSNDKQIEQYFSNDKLENDPNSSKQYS